MIGTNTLVLSIAVFLLLAAFGLFLILRLTYGPEFRWGYKWVFVIPALVVGPLIIYINATSIQGVGRAVSAVALLLAGLNVVLSAPPRKTMGKFAISLLILLAAIGFLAFVFGLPS